MAVEEDRRRPGRSRELGQQHRGGVGQLEWVEDRRARVLEQSRDLLVCLAERRVCLLRVAGGGDRGDGHELRELFPQLRHQRGGIHLATLTGFWRSYAGF